MEVVLAAGQLSVYTIYVLVWTMSCWIYMSALRAPAVARRLRPRMHIAQQVLLLCA
jgi:hypothetical protein